MARLKAKWNQKNRERTPEQIASAVGFNTWLLAAEACLNHENEGFETNSQSQRLDVISEYLAFSLHLVDRMTFGELEEEERESYEQEMFEAKMATAPETGKGNSKENTKGGKGVVYKGAL